MEVNSNMRSLEGRSPLNIHQLATGAVGCWVNTKLSAIRGEKRTLAPIKPMANEWSRNK